MPLAHILAPPIGVSALAIGACLQLQARTKVLACNHLTSKTLPSVRNWIPNMPRSQSLKATINIIAQKMLNSSGANMQPCLVPFRTSKSSDCSPPSMTHACMPSWKDGMMSTRPVGQPIFLRIFYHADLLTVSKAFVRSTKRTTRSGARDISPGAVGQ